MIFTNSRISVIVHLRETTSSAINSIALCGLSGTIHSYDLSKKSVHNINYLKDIKALYHDCSIFGDKGYIGAEIQLDLFETAHIRLECPYKLSQKNRKSTFIPFARTRKRVETLFSNLLTSFSLSGTTPRLQYINYINNKPIGRIKYALMQSRQRVKLSNNSN